MKKVMEFDFENCVGTMDSPTPQKQTLRAHNSSIYLYDLR